MGEVNKIVVDDGSYVVCQVVVVHQVQGQVAAGGYGVYGGYAVVQVAQPVLGNAVGVHNGGGGAKGLVGHIHHHRLQRGQAGSLGAYRGNAALGVVAVSDYAAAGVGDLGKQAVEVVGVFLAVVAAGDAVAFLHYAA